MSTTIFYFTGTGNCLKTARDLAAEIGDADIVNIAKVIDKEIDLSAERIGIIYPVYMFGMPLIVARFIRQLKAPQDKYIFAVATCASKAGNTLGQNARLLKSQGLELAAGFIIVMPGNYTPLYGAIPAEKQQKMFEREKQRVKEIAETVKNNRRRKLEKDSFLLRGLFSAIYQAASPRIPFLDKGFWADEKCTACGVCVKACPVDNIKLSDKKPEWLHRCEQCFACLQWCPEEAIQYGRNTSGKKRYRNPEVKLEDIILNR